MRTRHGRLPGLGASEVHWDGPPRPFLPDGQCPAYGACVFRRCRLLRYESSVYRLVQKFRTALQVACLHRTELPKDLPPLSSLLPVSSSPGILSSSAAFPLLCWIWERFWIGPCRNTRPIWTDFSAQAVLPSFAFCITETTPCHFEALHSARAYDHTIFCRVPNSCIGGSGTATCIANTKVISRPNYDIPFVDVQSRGSLNLRLLRSYLPSLRRFNRMLPPQTAVGLFSNCCVGALNTRIGSSGAGARRHTFAQTAGTGQGRTWALQFCQWGCSVVIPFFSSLLVLVAASVCKACIQPTPGAQSPLGSSMRFGTRPAPLRLILPLAVASPSRPVLDWSSTKPPKPQPRTRRTSVAHVGNLSRLASLWLHLIGFVTYPQCIWAMPTFLETPEIRQLFRQEFAHLHGNEGPVSSSHVADGTPFVPLDHCPGDSIDLPPHTHGPAPFSQDLWLGVTIFAPHVAPAAFALRAGRTAALEDILAWVRSSGRIPHPGFDALVPVQPQVHDDYLALIAYPSVIAQYAMPRCAVLIDLTRVGGHCHASILRTDITAETLLQNLRLQIRADIEDEDLQIWVGDSILPTNPRGVLSLANGTLITIMRRPYQPGRLTNVAALFDPDVPWGRIDHMPRPPKTFSLALCRGINLDPVCPFFFPWNSPEDIARRVYKLPPHSPIIVVDHEPALDVSGEPCRQAAVALSPLPGQQVGPAQPYYLDVRLLGEAPRLVFVSPPPAQAVDLPHILAEAQVEPPSPLVGTLLHNHIIGDSQFLSIGLDVGLAHRIFSACPSQPVVEGTHEASAPGYSTTRSDAEATRSPLPPHPVNLGPELQRLDPATEPPTAHEVLGLADPEQLDEQADRQQLTIFCLVFVPFFRPEYLRLDLTMPCELDDALRTVSAARCSTTAVHFDNLIPAEPQPTATFASILAVPDWVTTHTCCLIDTREVDGRLFASLVFGSMQRSWFLLHFGFPDDDTLQVIVAGERLEPNRLYQVQLGTTVTILPAGQVYRPGPLLADMLLSEEHWQEQCPQFEGPSDSSFFVLSDGGHTLMQVDRSQTLTPHLFKQLSVEAFQYRHEAVTVCRALPGTTDVAFQGQYCRAVIAATEAIPRLPIPPARPRPPNFILFIDQRLLLQGITWRVVPNGFLGLDKLTEEFQPFAPVGYAIHFKGCPTEQHGDRTFFRVAQGQTLIATYVEDNSVHTSQRSCSSGSSHGSQPHEDSDSDGSDSILRSPDTLTAPRPSRSRSPRGPPPPTPIHEQHRSWVLFAQGSLKGDLSIDMTARLPKPFQFTQNRHYLAQCFGPELMSVDIASSEMLPKQPVKTRFLTEPSGSNPGEERHLQHLRQLTLQLGGQWTANLRPLFPGEVEPPRPEHEFQEGRIMPVVMWVSCAILKDGFQPERLTVQLSVPATPGEAVAAIQEAREPVVRQLYPHILDVLPQPSHGTAVYIAVPAWCPTLQCACLDMTGLDGRIYAAILPDYIARREPLALVPSTQAREIDVFIGLEGQPVRHDEQVHLFPGVLITFLPALADPPLPYTMR